MRHGQGWPQKDELLQPGIQGYCGAIERTAMNECIAQRKLMFSLKGSSERKPFVVQIMAPRELKEGDVEFQFTKGTAVCIVQFEGLPSAKPEQIYGADSLQALQLATNVEPILKRLSKKYDLFFPTGEGYFEE